MAFGGRGVYLPDDDFLLIVIRGVSSACRKLFFCGLYTGTVTCGMMTVVCGGKLLFGLCFAVQRVRCVGHYGFAFFL